MTQALELIEVSVDYHRGGQPVHALDSVSLAIGRSESVAVMGPSGCGKSTLLGVLALTIPPTSGSVLVSGVPAPSSPDGRARTRNRLLGLIPQSGAVIDHLSVLAECLPSPGVQQAPHQAQGQARAGQTGPGRRRDRLGRGDHTPAALRWGASACGRRAGPGQPAALHPGR